ncbi:hypothetical protein fnug_329 [Pseudomonas phage fnug]|uniref:PHIKZ281 n=4 Tax=Phikzvirus TaxID=680115 RepID=Q8SCN1_BPDPK|nr:PHIKZ281 [Pseudomonas phage phiKZ]YP_009617359.1 hypothetical protein FDI90_gp071 [Pseudomonas phage PA7]ANM45096.1 hypothetical protein KTN4_338 [Pseudomonas phage KTN4]QJB22972.1 hypothetical protein fnug_329 [Pseudomonas phage fnug]UXD83310.1 hypothetical protein NP274_00258 [Pseudomonas phage Koomba boorn-mokiny kep-wari Wadjak 1]WNV48002.1 hypothetical protein [Pseudomonas phage fMGyn-Pae01]AAL83182.1 PHIKZ281 [Pseudomonas phage phiKZ]
MQLDKDKLKELVNIIEENTRLKGKVFHQEVYSSVHGEIEVRSYAGTFTFYKDHTTEHYAMFNVEFDTHGKVVRFIAPALLRATVIWELNEEPEYYKINIEHMLIEAVTNHFNTATLLP